ncbi:unnamed protein product [Amoebophrya sp. A120]|nr:unnamed protein product [Amoebophrya sp. A120]|eukprot:GSA120T00021469001.1
MAAPASDHEAMNLLEWSGSGSSEQGGAANRPGATPDDAGNTTNHPSSLGATIFPATTAAAEELTAQIVPPSAVLPVPIPETGPAAENHTTDQLQQTLMHTTATVAPTLDASQGSDKELLGGVYGIIQGGLNVYEENQKPTAESRPEGGRQPELEPRQLSAQEEKIAGLDVHRAPSGEEESAPEASLPPRRDDNDDDTEQEVEQNSVNVNRYNPSATTPAATSPAPQPPAASPSIGIARSTKAAASTVSEAAGAAGTNSSSFSSYPVPRMTGRNTTLPGEGYNNTFFDRDATLRAAEEEASRRMSAPAVAQHQPRPEGPSAVHHMTTGVLGDQNDVEPVASSFPSSSRAGRPQFYEHTQPDNPPVPEDVTTTSSASASATERVDAAQHVDGASSWVRPKQAPGINSATTTAGGTNMQTATGHGQTAGRVLQGILRREEDEVPEDHAQQSAYSSDEYDDDAFMTQKITQAQVAQRVLDAGIVTQKTTQAEAQKRVDRGRQNNRNLQAGTAERKILTKEQEMRGATNKRSTAGESRFEVGNAVSGASLSSPNPSTTEATSPKVTFEYNELDRIESAESYLQRALAFPRRNNNRASQVWKSSLVLSAEDENFVKWNRRTAAGLYYAFFAVSFAIVVLTTLDALWMNDQVFPKRLGVFEALKPPEFLLTVQILGLDRDFKNYRLAYENARDERAYLQPLPEDQKVAVPGAAITATASSGAPQQQGGPVRPGGAGGPGTTSPAGVQHQSETSTLPKTTDPVPLDTPSGPVVPPDKNQEFLARQAMEAAEDQVDRSGRGSSEAIDSEKIIVPPEEEKLQPAGVMAGSGPTSATPPSEENANVLPGEEIIKPPTAAPDAKAQTKTEGGVLGAAAAQPGAPLASGAPPTAASSSPLQLQQGAGAASSQISTPQLPSVSASALPAPPGAGTPTQANQVGQPSFRPVGAVEQLAATPVVVQPAAQQQQLFSPATGAATFPPQQPPSSSQLVQQPSPSTPFVTTAAAPGGTTVIVQAPGASAPSTAPAQPQQQPLPQQPQAIAPTAPPAQVALGAPTAGIAASTPTTAAPTPPGTTGAAPPPPAGTAVAGSMPPRTITSAMQFTSDGLGTVPTPSLLPPSFLQEEAAGTTTSARKLDGGAGASGFPNAAGAAVIPTVPGVASTAAVTSVASNYEKNEEGLHEEPVVVDTRPPVRGWGLLRREGGWAPRRKDRQIAQQVLVGNEALADATEEDGDSAFTHEKTAFSPLRHMLVKLDEIVVRPAKRVLYSVKEYLLHSPKYARRERGGSSGGAQSPEATNAPVVAVAPSSSSSDRREGGAVVGSSQQEQPEDQATEQFHDQQEGTSTSPFKAALINGYDFLAAALLQLSQQEKRSEQLAYWTQRFDKISSIEQRCLMKQGTGEEAGKVFVSENHGCLGGQAAGENLPAGSGSGTAGGQTASSVERNWSAYEPDLLHMSVRRMDDQTWGLYFARDLVATCVAAEAYPSACATKWQTVAGVAGDVKPPILVPSSPSSSATTTHQPYQMNPQETTSSKVPFIGRKLTVYSAAPAVQFVRFLGLFCLTIFGIVLFLFLLFFATGCKCCFPLQLYRTPMKVWLHEGQFVLSNWMLIFNIIAIAPTYVSHSATIQGELNDEMSPRTSSGRMLGAVFVMSLLIGVSIVLHALSHKYHWHAENRMKNLAEAAGAQLL